MKRKSAKPSIFLGLAVQSINPSIRMVNVCVAMGWPLEDILQTLTNILIDHRLVLEVK